MASNTTETRRTDKRAPEAEAQRREAPRLAAEPAPVRGRPANENDPGTSMMLAKLRRQPSYTPYYFAFFISLAWIAGWFFVFSNTMFGAAAATANIAETMKAEVFLR